MRKSIVGAVATVTMLISTEGQSQDIFTDVFREAVDEVRLQQDYRALQRDLATGNSMGAQYDMMRIQRDSANLARDQMQLNYDLNGSAAIGPYQNYGGYYYPQASGQTYYTPLQTPLQPVPQQGFAPMNPVPVGQVFVPLNPVPGVVQTVRISNPASTGVTLSFVLGNTTYSIDSGRTEAYSLNAPTVISFSRGGQAGVARYTLTGGNTFEFKYDNSGWYLVQKRIDPIVAPTNPVPSNPPPLNSTPVGVVPPSPASLPPAATPSPGPTLP